MELRFFAFYICLLISHLSYGEQTPNPAVSAKVENKEEIVYTSHQITIGGKRISYKASVGTQMLSECDSDPKGYIFFVAYTKDDVADKGKRPITFCFNGGPGAAAVWLHLGALGPKRIDMGEQGLQAVLPYHVNDNPYSILDLTDLVFIDPISTGYSRACPTNSEKEYHNFDKDIQSVAEFIRLYITRNDRWNSPLYLAGESYGTTRACGLAQHLHNKQRIDLAGIVLLSCALNFQTIDFNCGNDLPYALFLPSYTQTALYHKRLPPEMLKDPEKTRREAKEFAYGEYTHALMMGDEIGKEQFVACSDKLSKYTGIPAEYIRKANLRVHIYRFAKELLRDKDLIVGRFDSRVTGYDTDLCNDVFEYDPSFDNIFAIFTACFNDYVRSDLNWKKDSEYAVLADVHPWDFGDAKNQYLNVSDKLAEAMSKNPRMRVFVGNGYNDLATPYAATEYTVAHLGMHDQLKHNVVVKNYEGGHMMYLYYPSLVKLKSDLVEFYTERD